MWSVPAEAGDPGDALEGQADGQRGAATQVGTEDEGAGDDRVRDAEEGDVEGQIGAGHHHQNTRDGDDQAQTVHEVEDLFFGLCLGHCCVPPQDLVERMETASTSLLT